MAFGKQGGIHQTVVPDQLLVLIVPFGPFFGCSQVIQTVSAVDKDEPPSGHRFYFTLAPSVAGNLNFTLRDNKGDSFFCYCPFINLLITLLQSQSDGSNAVCTTGFS